VASESGRAQTIGIYPGGVVGPQYRLDKIKVTLWKVRPKRVTVPCSKVLFYLVVS
jgi:hypothetical protein